MKKIFSHSLKLLLSFVLFLAIVLVAYTQKIINVQETSLRAPTSIRVDGKATEWNQLQAYNKATELFYSLSNDDDKLYLTVKATDLDIINKIVCAGITLTVNGSGKMKDQEGQAITFPVLDRSTFPVVGPPIGFMLPRIIEKTEANQKLIDSFMESFNKELTAKAKDIRIEGIREITDTLISIYNPQGIKAAALIDNKRELTYELAVPLKYLALSINNPQSFVYNIKLTGMNPDMSSSPSFQTAINAQRPELRRGITRWLRIYGVYSYEGPTAARLQSMLSPTDFWGEYTLTK